MILDFDTRGFRGILTLEQETASTSENDKAGSGMAGAVDQLSSVAPSDKAPGTDDLKKTNIPENVKVDYSGDPIFTAPLKDFNDTIKAIRSFPKFARNSKKVMYYGLSPIKKYCESDLNTLIKEIGKDFTERLTDIPDEIAETILEVQDLMTYIPAVRYSNSIGKAMLKYYNNIIGFERKWTENVTALIKDYRKGDAKDLQLVETINQYEDRNPYSKFAAEAFLTNRRRELNTLEILTTEVENLGITIEDEDNGSGNICIFGHAYSVIYSLELLPDYDIVERFENITRQKGEDNYNETNAWFWNDTLIGQAGRTNRGFLLMFKTTEKKKESCFIIQLKKNGTESNLPRLKLFKNGRKVTDNYKTPSKVALPDNVTVSFNTVGFFVNYDNNENATNLLKVQCTETTQMDEITNSTDGKSFVRYFPLSANGSKNYFIMIDKLNHNTTYKFSVSAGSKDFGYGPDSENFYVTTNQFSSPKNFRNSSRTATSLKLTWSKPHNEQVPKSYLIVIYTKNDQELYEFPMKIEVLGNKTTKLIDNLPSTQKFFITIEAKGSKDTTAERLSYPYTVRNDSMAFLDTSTKPSQPFPPIVEETTHSSMSITFRVPEDLKDVETNYTFMYHRVIDGYHMRETITSMTQNQTILKDLEENSVYFLYVKLNTTFGETDYSEPAKARTLQLNSSYYDELRKSLGMDQVQENITNGKRK